MKLVQWPFMGGLLHLVQRGGAAARPGPSSLYNKQPTHQRPVYQSPHCCIMIRCSALLTWSLKG